MQSDQEQNFWNIQSAGSLLTGGVEGWGWEWGVGGETDGSRGRKKGRFHNEVGFILRVWCYISTALCDERGHFCWHFICRRRSVLAVSMQKQTHFLGGFVSVFLKSATFGQIRQKHLCVIYWMLVLKGDTNTMSWGCVSITTSCFYLKLLFTYVKRCMMYSLI